VHTTVRHAGGTCLGALIPHAVQSVIRRLGRLDHNAMQLPDADWLHRVLAGEQSAFAMHHSLLASALHHWRRSVSRLAPIPRSGFVLRPPQWSYQNKGAHYPCRHRREERVWI